MPGEVFGERFSHHSTDMFYKTHVYVELYIGGEGPVAYLDFLPSKFCSPKGVLYTPYCYELGLPQFQREEALKQGSKK